MKINQSLKIDLFLPFILVVAAFLLLYHLDHRPFWQDEAETGCLARNVLKYGVPKAFDGVNLISQENRQEFGQDYLWAWSPWLQIYVAAASFYLAQPGTVAGRLPFALLGLGSVLLVYLLVKRHFGDLLWARLTAALLTFSVPFLLFARQCRYYSLVVFLVLVSLYAFRSRWQERWGPAVVIMVSLGLLFHANYLTFFSYSLPFLVAAILVYRHDLPVTRCALITTGIALFVLPGLFFFRIQQQSSMVYVEIIGRNLDKHLHDLFQFVIALPVVLGLLWCGYQARRNRAQTGNSGDPASRFVLFLTIIIFLNILVIILVPQSEHRYLIHLYPLAAIISGWLICKVWRYHRFSGILLTFLLIFTNWLHLIPLELTGLLYRPAHNSVFMLTYPNLPLKLYLTELFCGYPDVNQNFIRFFQAQARAGATILTTYGDLPLQFYTSCQVLGGLQGDVPSWGASPDWVVKRWDIRWDRNYELIKSEKFILDNVRLTTDYEALTLPYEDEVFGNRADPYYHRFLPETEPINQIIIYRKKSKVDDHEP